MITPENSSKTQPKAATNEAKKIAKPTLAQVNSLTAMFNKGRLLESEKLASKITQQFPQDGFGWKVLGAIRQQQGLVAQAFEALQMAAALLPNDSEAHYNLANCYYDKNQLQEAASSYQAAIKINPRFAQAHYNLGSVFKDQGLFAEAEACYKTALKISPDNAQMHFNLALMLYEQGRFSDAIDYFQICLKKQPDFTAAHVNLGASFKASGQLEKAEACYRKALSLSPDHAEAHNNLGVVLKELGNLVDAERCYRAIIALRPEYSSAYNNLGLLLKDLGRFAESESCYLTALKYDPLLAVAHNNLSVLFRVQGRFADSVTSSKNALLLKPDYVDAYDNLGLALDAMGLFADAEVAFEQALKLAPDNIIVLSNFSITLNTLCQLTRAEVYLKKALALAPEFINAHVNLCVNYLAQGRVEDAEATCVNALKIEPGNMFAQNNLLFSMNYLANHSVKECVDTALEYGYVVASNVERPFTSWQHKVPAKRLRVGFVSGDLRQHAVAFFLENLLQHTDPARVEFFAYQTTNHDDAMTARLKSHCSGWKSLAGLNDEVAATLIHHDGLHVLLDLSGHSSGNRLPIFAWKPAPLQVSWLGYFATTGLAEMDYFIADEVGVPTENQAQFVEKIKYLPDTRLCFTAPTAAIEIASLPALINGYITFGCFQNMAKVSDEVLDLWAEVITASPNAKFRWQCKSFKDTSVADSLTNRLVQRGVPAKNIILLASAEREEYLAAHNKVDVILDTFPFPGGTTTCEALWMGVPTLTLAGNTLISRQGASLLTAAGLGDWVAKTKAEYLDKSLLFCSDLVKLSKLRAGLRAQVLVSPLFDATRFAKNMEQLLWEIWDASQSQSTEATTIKAKKISALTKVTDEKSDLRTGIKVEIISATKLSEDDFWAKSALGLSLKRHLKQDARLSVSVAFNNSRGLSEIFNACIEQADEQAVLIFIHDDVWVDEANFVDTVIEGLEHYDVIGVAGNLRRVAFQPAWAFVDAKFTWDDKSNLSGCIAHGKNAFSKQTVFGKVPAECELLDGVFLACKKNSLVQKNVQFDPQFDFHFYDMDFCRSARQAGLKLGTWQIKLTHQSAGAFGSQHWMNKYKLYLNKWEAPSANNKMIYSEDEITQTQELQMAMNDVLQMALTHQNVGEIEQAKNLYLEIVNIQPRHAEANHNLGVIEANMNGALVALPRLEIAVQAKPENEQYWVTYIDALMQSGATDTAADALELGRNYGLRSETAQLMAAEFVKAMELSVNRNTSISQLISNDSILQLLGQVLTENIDEINASLNENNINKALSAKVKQNNFSDKNNKKISFRKNISPHLNLAAFEKTINTLNAGNHQNEILELIFKSILGIKLQTELIGTKIFTPYFDGVLENIDLGISNVIPRNTKMANIVIASEIYDFGGHTKVINEILESVENPILIITDIYNRFAQQNLFEKVSSTLVKCPVFILPNESYLDKSTRLSAFINGYAKNVFLVSHHDDVVAIAGCQKNLDSHFYFVHHADHNPALGNTVEHFQHVDLFRGIAELCAEDLKKEVILLPTAASDCGAKKFNYPIESFSTVTAGSFGKFMMFGELSLPNIIVATLSTCRGKHYHFGDIPTEYLELINEQLIDAGLKPESFVYMGTVPSLWKSLLEIDAHVFIGSAPKRGGKSEIEAQGASYPLLIYKDIDAPKYLNVASCNASTIHWSAISDLKAGLAAIMVNHAARSAESRQFYLENYAKENFIKVISELSR